MNDKLIDATAILAAIVLVAAMCINAQHVASVSNKEYLIVDKNNAQTEYWVVPGKDLNYRGFADPNTNATFNIGKKVISLSGKIEIYEIDDSTYNNAIKQYGLENAKRMNM